MISMASSNSDLIILPDTSDLRQKNIPLKRDIHAYKIWGVNRVL